MLKKTLTIFAVFFSLLVAGCESSDDPSDAANGNTALVYDGKGADGNGMELIYDNMLKNLTIGPIDVRPYEQIRIITEGMQGSGRILVFIYETDEDGEIIDTLDKLELDFDTGAWITKVYEVPGRWIKINYTISAPALPSHFVSCLIYGR